MTQTTGDGGRAIQRSQPPLDLPVESGAMPTPPTHDAQPAFRRIRFAFITFVVGGLAAAVWDGWYHRSVAFDGFFSPPHVLGYAMALFVSWLTADTVFRAGLRRPFANAFPMPGFRYHVPGSLVLLGGGLVMLGLAGLVFDNFWHTNFGLNETAWSFPHAMIGWSLLVILIGFSSARLALGRLTWGWSVTLGILIASIGTGALLGPLAGNHTPATVRASMNLPGLAQQAEIQQVSEMILQYNLTRMNPLILIFAPLAAAATFAFLTRIEPRGGIILGIALLLSLDNPGNVNDLLVYDPTLLQVRANYAGMPYIWLVGIAGLLMRFRVNRTAAWAVGGGVFSLLIHATYTLPVGVWGLALIGIPMGALGAWVGDRIHQIAAAPKTFKTLLPLFVLGVGVPLLTGLIDLGLRGGAR